MNNGEVPESRASVFRSKTSLETGDAFLEYAEPRGSSGFSRRVQWQAAELQVLLDDEDKNWAFFLSSPILLGLALVS